MKPIFQHLSTLLFPPVDTPAVPLVLPTETEELDSLKRRIRSAESRFAFAKDDGEITAVIYELTALEARYDLLVGRMRASAGQAG